MSPSDSLYVKFIFPTRILYKGVPDFANECPCGVWCRKLKPLASCITVHVLETSFKRQLFCNFAIMENSFFIVFDSLYTFLFVYILMFRNIFTSQIVLHFAKYYSTFLFSSIC